MYTHSKIDYLTVGHVCRDLTPYGYTAGGTAAYSSRVARMLGCQTAVLTRTNPEYDLDTILPDIEVCNVPSAETTTFENVYTQKGRHQTLHSVAGTIRPNHVPKEWRRASIVHLGPIANEIDPELVAMFSNSLIGVTPQGWYRRWGTDGQVYTDDWPAASKVLPLAGAVILSLEDIPEVGILDQIRKLAPLVVLTQQSKGCTIFFRDEIRQITAPNVEEVNPTGAGDVFAAAFLTRLEQTRGNPWEAGEFANRIASESVCYEDLSAKLKAIQKIVET